LHSRINMPQTIGVWCIINTSCNCPVGFIHINISRTLVNVTIMAWTCNRALIIQFKKYLHTQNTQIWIFTQKIVFIPKIRLLALQSPHMLLHFIVVYFSQVCPSLHLSILASFLTALLHQNFNVFSGKISGWSASSSYIPNIPHPKWKKRSRRISACNFRNAHIQNKKRKKFSSKL